MLCVEHIKKVKMQRTVSCYVLTSVIVFYYLFSPHSLYAIGSDTAVGRFSTQVTLANGERVASFTSLEGGFILASSAAKATFDAVFPVSGKIDLNSGILVLKQDFRCENGADLVWLGQVIGNGYLFDLAPTISLITSESKVDSRECSVGLLFSQAINATLIAGDWSFDKQYIGVSANNRLSVYRFSETGATFQNSVDIATLLLVPATVYTVRWRPTGYFIAIGTQSLLGLSQELRMFSFNPAGPSLTQVDSENIGADCTAVAWHPSGNYLAVGSLNTTSEIILYSVSAGGILTQQQVVNLVPTRTVNFRTMDWNATGEFLSVGTAVSGTDPNLLVYQFNQAVPSLTLQASQAPLKLVWGTSWNQTYTDVLAVTYQTGSGDLIEIFQHNLTGLTPSTRLVKKSGVTGTTIAYSCHWHEDGHCLAIGKDVSGSSTEFRIYDFDRSTFALSFVQGFESSSIVQTVRWGDNSDYILAGGNGNFVNFYKKASLDCFSFWDTHVLLNHDVIVKDACITFSGSSSINGRGNKLILNGDAEIIVDKKGSLLLQDVIVEGIHGHNIRCTDNKSTLSLEQTTLILDDDYSFSVGHFDVLLDCAIAGYEYTFSYETNQMSTVQPNSTLMLTDDLIFFYNPPSNMKNLLKFVDRSSQLVLSNVTLCSTKTGIQFTQGTIIVDGESVFKSDSVVKNEGIMFGDGTNSAQNIKIKLLSEAGILVDSGFLVYQNI